MTIVLNIVAVASSVSLDPENKPEDTIKAVYDKPNSIQRKETSSAIILPYMAVGIKIFYKDMLMGF
jgi:hypothetical protein